MRASLPLLAALVAMLLAAPLATAQGTVYVQLDYIAVTPGSEVDYLALEEDVWQPIHEERRQRGALLDWVLYDVRFAPAGLAYDYVTANVFGDLISAEADDIRSAIAAAHPDRSVDEVLAQTRSAREIVHSELWALVTSLAPDGGERPEGRHLAVNFMSVPEDGRAEYFSVEQDVWAPIHQVRANDGSMGGWGLYSLVLPRGTALDYQFGTVDYFDDLDAAAAGITGAQIGLAHTGATQDEIDAMMDRTDASRAIVKTELWTRLATLGPPDS